MMMMMIRYRKIKRVNLCTLDQSFLQNQTTFMQLVAMNDNKHSDGSCYHEINKETKQAFVTGSLEKCLLCNGKARNIFKQIMFVL